MAKTLYRIDRVIPGGFQDSLLRLGSASDDLEGLPSFGGSNPALYGNEAAAKTVVDHLRVWFPRTDPIHGVAHALDIEYRVVPVVLKTQYFLPVTGEHVSRKWVATALREQRKARPHREIHRMHHSSYRTHSYVLSMPGGDMRISAHCPATTPRGWDCVEA